MITTSLSYISSLLLLCSVIVLISSKSKSKLFEYFPAIVIIYFVIVLLSACGFWDTKSTEIIQTRSQLQDLILPIMLFLMLILCDIRMVIRFGRKHKYHDLICDNVSNYWKIYIPQMLGKVSRHYQLVGWVVLGNMVTVKQALATPDNQTGYILLTDLISYTLFGLHFYLH